MQALERCSRREEDAYGKGSQRIVMLPQNSYCDLTIIGVRGSLETFKLKGFGLRKESLSKKLIHERRSLKGFESNVSIENCSLIKSFREYSTRF